MSVTSAILNFIFIKESSIVTIRSPKYNSEGYTLVEMLVVISIVGIILGLSVPSLLALNKPLRDGTLQFRSHLSLIRSKAISSNQAYRIRPKYPTAAQYRGERATTYQNTPHNFIVEHAANCQVNTYGPGLSSNPLSTDPEHPYNPIYPNGTYDGWQAASQFDLDLPETVGVVGTTVVNGSPVVNTSKTFQLANMTAAPVVTFDPNLNWEICYDNRGVAFQTVSVTLRDFQGNNLARSATVQVFGVGGTTIVTTNASNVAIPPDPQGNPVF
jgi:prepilin-type N-terminal cleavage/methylation domain-containing protein